MKIGAIILARFDSARLPGKGLRDLADQPMLRHVVQMCRAARGVESVALATTDRECDQPLRDFAAQEGIPCICGSLDDVANRFHHAMQMLQLDAAFRVNGDSPLIRPFLLEQALAHFRRGGCDLVSNVPERTYPFGLSVELVSEKAMQRACERIASTAEREHVTKYIYNHTDEFSICTMKADSMDFNGVQLAVDSMFDLARTDWIIRNLKSPMAMASVEELVLLAKKFDQSPFVQAGQEH